MFDLSNITLAFSTESAATEAFALMQADMMAWHAAGEYPVNPDLIAAIGAGMPHLGASSLKTYASALLKWARSGKTPASIRACVNSNPEGKGKGKGKGGRPAGKGKGKTTAPVADKAQAAPDAVPNDDAAWLRFINDMRSKVNGRKDWPADRIVAFQDTTATLIALLKSVAK